MTITHPLMPGVLAALRAEPQTLPEILRRMGAGRPAPCHLIKKTSSALAALEDAGRAERVTLESGGWIVPAWRLSQPSHAEARIPQRSEVTA